MLKCFFNFMVWTLAENVSVYFIVNEPIYALASRRGCDKIVFNCNVDGVSDGIYARLCRIRD